MRLPMCQIHTTATPGRASLGSSSNWAQPHTAHVAAAVACYAATICARELAQAVCLPPACRHCRAGESPTPPWPRAAPPPPTHPIPSAPSAYPRMKPNAARPSMTPAAAGCEARNTRGPSTTHGPDSPPPSPSPLPLPSEGHDPQATSLRDARHGHASDVCGEVAGGASAAAGGPGGGGGRAAPGGAGPARAESAQRRTLSWQLATTIEWCPP